MKLKGMRSSEVSYLLRRELGPIRDWSDCLADMRAEKTDIAGLRLLPLGVMAAGCGRPIYQPASVIEFIKEVRLLIPEARKGISYQTVEVEIDLLDERCWKHRKAKPVTIH
ncbi:hypothetical protein [Ferribacterium limneticum]|uniref:hypothetical protein n=1 Tax=Ferribacterium limneticum TaxID=76259 RepID=UPI001CF8558A|nr:hypothetical protein [Ferribacterium limneticum]UCV22857.1 hypothetical protein KI613_20500 [Ferribacterium limneticum]